MATPFDFDIHEYSRIIRRRKWWGILAFVLVLGSVAYLTLMQSPVWTAVVTLRVSSQEPMATIQGTAINYYGMRSGLDTETKLIEQYASLHRAVIEALRLDAEGSADFSLPADFGERALRGAIIAEQEDRSDLIRVSISAGDADLAVRIADALAQCYREHYVSSRTHEAEEKMNLIRQNLDTVNADHAKAQAALGALQQNGEVSGTTSVYRTRLAEIDVQLTELQQKYTDKHPTVVNLRNEKRELANKLRELPAQELEAERLKARCDQLASLQEELHRQLFAAQVDYRARKEEITQKISIVSNARDSVKKIKPNEGSNVVVGALLGSIIGLILCFAVEALDTSIGTIEDVERWTGLTVLGLIPYVSKGAAPKKAPKSESGEEDPAGDIRKRIIVNVTPNPVMGEAYRALRTNMQFVFKDDADHRLVLISSAGPSEGKTTNAMNLSIVLAQTGSRTLFIDGDLRHPVVHRILGLPRGPGLADLLLGTCSVEEATRTTEDLLMGAMDWDSVVGTQGLDNLHVITCGSFCPNPTELLAAQNTRSVLAQLREAYDYVLIDCAPIIPVADATILGATVDGVLVVYQVGKSSRHMLLRALKQIQVGGSQLLGIVLNQIESDIQFRSYKYYRSSRDTA